jgi:hypothetical protein
MLFWGKTEVSLPLLFCVRLKRAAVQKMLCLCNFVFFGNLHLNILALKTPYIILSLNHTLTFIFCSFECLIFYPGGIIVFVFWETVILQVSEEFWKFCMLIEFETNIVTEFSFYWYLFHTSRCSKSLTPKSADGTVYSDRLIPPCAANRWQRKSAIIKVSVFTNLCFFVSKLWLHKCSH